MPAIQLQTLNLRRRAPVIGLVVLYVYVGFHALSGSQGLVSWFDHEDRAVTLGAKLDRLEEQRSGLQGEVDRLSARSLDLDALDIEARRKLFVSKPGEITIWLDPS